MTDALKSAIAAALRQSFGAVLLIGSDDGESIFVDGRAGVVLTADAPVEADCVWRASSETLARALEGGRALESAYLSGRLRIAGDMSVMARLVLEGGR